jgi:hypothetical protein
MSLIDDDDSIVVRHILLDTIMLIKNCLYLIMITN